MKKEITTIKLRKRTVELLNKLKVHPRQPYEEIILWFIHKHQRKKFDFSKLKSGKEQITTIKLHKNTVELLNKLKIHPRQSYEEVILKLISENEKASKKNR